MPHYDTVIFDLDGTLLDTLDDLANAVNYALREMNWPERSRDEVRRFVGNGVAKLMERAVPAGTAPEETARALALFKHRYAMHSKDNTAPYPGVPELLRALRLRGCRLAVASNKFDSAVKALMPDYFPGLLDAAAGEAEDRGVPKKPDPAMVRNLMAELGAVPERTVYVGDSDVDLQTAANAGLACVAVTWGFRNEAFLRAHGAALLAHTPAEILKFVE